MLPLNHLGTAQNHLIMRIMEKWDKFSSPEWGSAKSHRQRCDGDDADVAAGALDDGFYDASDPSEDDLWFLPGDLVDADPAVQPGPQVDRQNLYDIQEWQKAEAQCARSLANLTLQVGIFIARLGQGPAGWAQRLALREAADLSWLAGDRVGVDRLALWRALRLQGDADDTQELLRAGWAVRRLTDGAGPEEDLAGFLGRHAPGAAEALEHQIADWHEIQRDGAGLHPITQGALSFHTWSLTGLSEGHVLGGAAPLPLIEAAVVSARLSLGEMQIPGGATTGMFLPLALGGARALRATGSVAERLQRWVAGAEQGVRAALRELDAIAHWEAQTQKICTDLSGRTPQQLIKLLRDWPLVSAAMAEAQTGASRAAVQRNLALFEDRGIAREITGQGRYRFWKAAV